MTKFWISEQHFVECPAASGYSVVPSDLRIPPEQYSLLASRKVSEAGNMSLLSYLSVNTIAYHQNGVPLEIKAVKWLKKRGVGGKDRMVAYTNDKKYVRYPLVPSAERALFSIAACTRSPPTTPSWVRLSRCTKKPCPTVDGI